MASSNPAFVRKSSSMRCAISGRKGAASTPDGSAMLPPDLACPSEGSSWASPSLPREELESLINVASSVPGKRWKSCGPMRPAALSSCCCRGSTRQDLVLRVRVLLRDMPGASDAALGCFSSGAPRPLRGPPPAVPSGTPSRARRARLCPLGQGGALRANTFCFTSEAKCSRKSLFSALRRWSSGCFSSCRRNSRFSARSAAIASSSGPPGPAAMADRPPPSRMPPPTWASSACVGEAARLDADAVGLAWPSARLPPCRKRVAELRSCWTWAMLRRLLRASLPTRRPTL
mmetsp:Transcript_94509/g.299965  ORF Transcript_94509/g.299965 Transcript_94509/m.299965 type:complete len:289 (-) Transcript_94509:479-1345(-)